jgi:hypothetical protein
MFFFIKKSSDLCAGFGLLLLQRTAQTESRRVQDLKKYKKITHELNF